MPDDPTTKDAGADRCDDDPVLTELRERTEDARRFLQHAREVPYLRS